MKLYKRTGTYKASNVTFDPKTITAVSYDWWIFVKVVNGRVVFNSYTYSNTTSRHQSKVRSLLTSLGITVDRVVRIQGGLQGIETLKELNRLAAETEAWIAERAASKRKAANERAKARRAELKAQAAASTPMLRLVQS